MLGVGTSAYLLRLVVKPLKNEPFVAPLDRNDFIEADRRAHLVLRLEFVLYYGANYLCI